MSQLSPRRSPRKPVPRSPMLTKTPPHWKKPEDVMRNRKLRLKRTALTARMNKCDSLSPKSHRSPVKTPTRSPAKRKNPFRRGDLVSSCSPKKLKECKIELNHEESLNQIFGLDSAESNSQDWSFLNFSFDAFDKNKEEEEGTAACVTTVLPVDWTLRLKMKFYSASAFPWNQVLKTCEEASGTTGFVRCIDSSDHDDSLGLDTSPSARFHQYNLYWQHPHLPWLDLFPRTNAKRAGETGKPAPLITMYPNIKDSLMKDWADSFRSLFQLLRARHCPYFYVIGNSFNCLFRAAGINGCTETTALVNPTTAGFRKMMLKEAISFSLPLKPKSQRPSSEGVDCDEPEEDRDDVDDDIEDSNDWLASLNVGQEDIDQLNISLNNSKDKKTSTLNDASLVLIEGSEVSAFFNFLINCKTLISLTGPLAGVPPTLLSPVGFHGGALTSLKARRSVVKVKNDSYHTIELSGPILPHTVHNLCSLLKESCASYSVTFADLDTTKSFASGSSQSDTIQESPVKTPSGRAFNVENLNDCGFKPQVLASFCSQDTRPFDCIKYSEGLFACS